MVNYIENYIENIEKILIEALFDNSSNLDKKALVQKLQYIHNEYSKQRNDFFSIVADDLSAKAYALYYGIVNSYKTYHLLNQLRISSSPKNILDFGAGPGSCSWAAMQIFNSISSASFVEHNPFMANVLEKSIKTISNKIKFNCYENLSDLPDEKYDLILSGNAINELSFNDASETIFKFVELMSDNGILLILEPGSKEITRNLMTIREVLVKDKNLKNYINILYPCTHKNSCKLLNDNTQWCHSDVFFDRTETIRYFDSQLGLNKHTVSFSALILQKSNYSQSLNNYRVITEPKVNKAGATGYICGNNYQGLVTLQKRDKKDSNKLFFKSKMHTLIEYIEEFKVTPQADKNTV